MGCLFSLSLLRVLGMPNSFSVCFTAPSPMAAYDINTVDELRMSIRVCSQKRFTGRLDFRIKDIQEPQWSLFFRLGCLVGGISKVHPIRRWYRQLTQHCPQLVTPSARQGTDHFQYLDQSALTGLVKQGKLSQEQMMAIVKSNLVEILFDIIQLAKQRRYQLGTELVHGELPPDVTALMAGFIQPEQVWQQAIQAWDEWQQAGLERWSPNWAPVIWDVEALRQQTSFLAYHNLKTLVNGDRTLRDLAVQLKQPLVSLCQSLLPYIRQGIMGLIEVRDFHHVSKPATVPSSSTPTTPISPTSVRSSSSLVAYIEDSRFDCITMNQILTQAGCRFINIQDPLQALPILMEQKPSLIFLDLLMPVTNGYEVCAQIRRVSALRYTPVIIVTSSDGIVDRVRAKLVGSSGFISKPIEPEKVLTVLQNHLP